MASANDDITLRIDGRDVVVTHSSKLLIPDAKVRKLDLVNYYVAVAEGALRGAGGRPCMLVRYPDGIGGEFFFQKRVVCPPPEAYDLSSVGTRSNPKAPMKKRQFLVAAAAAGMLPAATPAFANAPKSGPVLLTIGGSITKGNRGPVDTTLDQLMVRHGIQFSTALALDQRDCTGCRRSIFDRLWSTTTSSTS